MGWVALMLCRKTRKKIMRTKLTQTELNAASWELQDFENERCGTVTDFADYFYDVAKALGYDTDKFVALLEDKFHKECAEVIARIKVSEGW